MKKTTLAVALALSMSGTAVASDINVGGVVWDPDYSDGSDFDFIGEFSFTQWYSNVNVTEGDAASLQSSIDNVKNLGTDILPSLNGSTNGTSFYLSGGGEFTRINQPDSQSSDPLPHHTFCPSCELTMTFGGLNLRNDGSIDASGGWINLWVDETPDFVTPVNLTDVPNLTDGDLWLSANFTNFQFLIGGVSGGFADVSLQVDGGLAADNFLDAEDAGVAQQIASAFFFDFSTGAINDFASGTGSVRGSTIPTPGSLALIGLGLLAAGVTARRKA